nr:hypothetical protein [Tanacetum cinerariifolium]
MDQKLKGYAAKNAENKRRFENNPRDNRVQKPPFKRQNVSGQNVARAYTVGNSEKKGDCKTAVATTTQRAPMENQRIVTCFGYGGHGYYKRDCPKLKSQNRGNKASSNETRGRAYALGGGDGNPDSNVVTCTFLLNNRYVYIQFDYGADRSFVLTTFSALIDITLNALDGFTAVLAVFITGASHSRQHVVTSFIRMKLHKSPTKSLLDVASSKISIVIGNT